MRIEIEGFFDIPQKTAADDAAATPHEGDAAHVQIPAVLFARRLQQHVALRIRDHLGAIERAADVLDERIAVRINLRGRWSLENLRCGDALLLERRKATRKD